MHLDHVVMWVADPLASIDFYTHVIGLESVRAEEFRNGEAPFPSVRVSPESIIDLSPLDAADRTDSQTKTTGSAGHPVNHVCLAMSHAEFTALDARLSEAGVDTSARMDRRTFGARGWAPTAFYFHDPDGNVIEARYYE